MKEYRVTLSISADNFAEVNDVVEFIAEQCEAITGAWLDDWKHVHSDGLPEYDGRYMVCRLVGGHRYVRMCAYRHGEWIAAGQVYAWREIPEPASSIYAPEDYAEIDREFGESIPDDLF